MYLDGTKAISIVAIYEVGSFRNGQTDAGGVSFFENLYSFFWKDITGRSLADMADRENQKDPALQEPWPIFLDLIDTRPDAANELFARFLYKFFHIWVPPRLRGVSKDRFLEFVHDCYIDFTADNHRKLRQYRNQGKPFASWFLIASSNLAHDWARRSRNLDLDSAARPSDDDARDEYWEATITKALGPRPDQEASSIWRELLDLVRAFMKTMDQRQQLLLTLSAEGYNPRDIVKLLGESADKNKSISDDIRYARSRLRQKVDEYLRKSGLDLSDYFES